MSLLPKKTIEVPLETFRGATAVAYDDDPARETIARAQQHLLAQQKADGYWVGELFVDSTLVSDVVAFMHWTGDVDFNKQSRCVKSLLERQMPDGGWNTYYRGPSELNATLKAYFALKLSGFSPTDPRMLKAHATIVRLGGIPKSNTYTKLFLALFGQFPWKHLPIIPSEIILLPTWLYFNIYEMSSWSRGMVVPLSIINHFKPVRYLPPDKQLHELFPYGTEHSNLGLPFDKKLFTWKNFFLGWNKALKFLDSLAWKPFRRRALRKAEAWILERIGEGCDGLGAIFPSMMYTIMVLKTLGYSDDHPVVRKAQKDFMDLEVHDEKGDEFRMQPCLSPIWDSAITAFALVESGIPSDDPRIQKAGRMDHLQGSEGFSRRLEPQEPYADHQRLGLRVQQQVSIPTSTTPSRSCSPSA